MNALKHGGRSHKMEYVRQMLRLNAELIKMTRLWHKSEKYIDIRLALKQKSLTNELEEFMRSSSRYFRNKLLHF